MYAVWLHSSVIDTFVVSMCEVKCSAMVAVMGY